MLVLAEPTAEGYAAACLARFGEGPIAVALDGECPRRPRRAHQPGERRAGRGVFQLGPVDGPTLIFLPPSG